MTQEPDKSLSETTIVEKAALELVKSDMNTAEKAPQPLPDIRKPAPVKGTTAQCASARPVRPAAKCMPTKPFRAYAPNVATAALLTPEPI